MPPKRYGKGSAGARPTHGDAKEERSTELPDQAEVSPKEELPRNSKIGSKRPPPEDALQGNGSSNKRAKSNKSKPAQEGSRRSQRGGSRPSPSKAQLLNYLLSKAGEELCRPEDESEDIKARGTIRTYSSSVFNPFEELVSAVVLSRPISHRLGLRTIRTILNDPYNFTSAKAVKDAGKEKHHQALWDAKTQHKGKTADQLGLLADVTLQKFTASGDKDGTQLQKVLDDSGNDVDRALDLLKESVKGIGKTGLEIFLRRVQWLWEAGYPFVDGKSAQSLRKLGLPSGAEDLRGVLEANWSKLDTKRLAGNTDQAKKRRAFVIVLERATGADLEGKEDAVAEAAAASSS